MITTNNIQQCFWYAPDPYVRLAVLSLTTSKTGYAFCCAYAECTLDYLWRQYLLADDVFLIQSESCSEEHSSVIS